MMTRAIPANVPSTTSRQTDHANQLGRSNLDLPCLASEIYIAATTTAVTPPNMAPVQLITLMKLPKLMRATTIGTIVASVQEDSELKPTSSLNVSRRIAAKGYEYSPY